MGLGDPEESHLSDLGNQGGLPRGRDILAEAWRIHSEVKVAQLYPTLCDPVDYRVHGILQARILEWRAFPFSRESSQPRDRTQVSYITDWFFTSWATREAQEYWSGRLILSPGDLSDPGIASRSLALQTVSLPAELSGKPWHIIITQISNFTLRGLLLVLKILWVGIVSFTLAELMCWCLHDVSSSFFCLFTCIYYKRHIRERQRCRHREETCSHGGKG